MYRISYRFLVPGWSAKPLVSTHDRIMGTHRAGEEGQVVFDRLLRQAPVLGESVLATAIAQQLAEFGHLSLD